MSKRIVSAVVAVTLLGIGLWYWSRPATARAPTTSSSRGTVQPNAALADIFTQLEAEWGEARPTPGTGTGSTRGATTVKEKTKEKTKEEEDR
jgi:hypothetical protein